MKTLFLLMAQYNGQAVIPLPTLCQDYFSHLTPIKLQRKIMAGDIDLPITRIGDTQKATKGVHVEDLAAYLDKQRAIALSENDKLHGRPATKKAS